MTTCDGISNTGLSIMQNIVVEEAFCPKCQKGKLRPTYLNVDLDLIWLCSKCLYPLDENNLNDHIISSRTSAVLPTRQPRKRKHFECESAQLVPTETTSGICNNYNITQAELEDINTCSQLNKKARYDDTTAVWSDGNDTLLTRVNNTTDAQSLIDDTGLGRGELLTFDLRDVT